MKRSKAVEEIRKILAMNGKDNGEGELEEAILHHLETLGLKPPTIKVIETRPAYNDKWQIAGSYTTSYDKNIWEPEDD